jgi:hypothetical protein
VKKKFEVDVCQVERVTVQVLGAPTPPDHLPLDAQIVQQHATYGGFKAHHVH